MQRRHCTARLRFETLKSRHVYDRMFARSGELALCGSDLEAAHQYYMATGRLPFAALGKFP